MLLKAAHIFFIAMGLLTVAWAAPAGVGLAGESGPVQRDPSSPATSGGRSRYVFIGGYGGGK